MFSETDLVTELITRFGAQITILYGSHARGRAEPSSDLDVVCFCSVSERYPSTFRWRGLLVDAWIHPLSDLSLVQDFRKLHDGRVIQDFQGHGERLLDSVRASLRELRAPLDAHHDRHVRAWIWKMLDRAAGPGLHADHRRHWLLSELPEVWCDLNQRHFLGPQIAFDEMRRSSSELYSTAERALKPDATLDDIEQLVALIVGPRSEPD